MSATVRKNFVFREEVARHLEEMAADEGKSMTAWVEEAIEEKYGSKRVAKRVAAFKRSIALADSLGEGLFAGKSIQSIKACRDAI